MNLFVYPLMAIYLVTLPSRGSKSIVSRHRRSPVFGGIEVTISEYPFFVTLEFRNGYQLCGGAIVSRHFIVTAAHCFKLDSNTNEYIIRAGSNTKGVGGTVRNITSLDKHPNYTTGKMCTPDCTPFNDIAVVGVDVSFKLDKYHREDRIRLFQYGDKVEPGAEATIIGIGGTEYGPTDRLKGAVILITDRENCTKSWLEIDPIPIPESVICAGVGKDKRDTCDRDSGSPLVVGNRLAGITSYGTECGTPGVPTLYTEVAQFEKWILQTIKFRMMFREDC